MTAHPELLVPLLALPGLDPVGLWVRHRASPSACRWLVTEHLPAIEGRYPQPSRCVVAHGGPHNVGDVDDKLRLNLADSATRDRVTRWIGARSNKAMDHSSAPWWEWHGPRRVWALIANRWVHYYSPFGDEIETADPLLAVLALRDLDPQDFTTLPDNSRRVDAHALALVAVHLGQQVQP